MPMLLLLISIPETAKLSGLSSPTSIPIILFCSLAKLVFELHPLIAKSENKIILFSVFLFSKYFSDSFIALRASVLL